MKAWYTALSTAEMIFFWIAIVGTALLIIQIIMMLFSFGGADASPDADFGGDGDFDTPDGDLGVSLFTLKGITAFLSFGGWTGLLILQMNEKNIALAVILSVVVGVFAMLLIALAMRGISKLQCDGTLDKDKLIGKEASVYVSIAPSRTGRGKITMTAQGAYRELDAVTDEEVRIPVDERVIISEVGVDYMVVKRVSAAPAAALEESGEKTDEKKE